MKKIFIIALVLLLGSGTMAAQRQRMTVEDRVARMAKQLSLTEEQQKKITAIYTDFESKRNKGERPTREQMREEMKKVEQQVNEVLTDEQKAKYEKMKKARQNNGRPTRRVFQDSVNANA